MLNIFKNFTTKKKLILTGIVFFLMIGVVVLYFFRLINDVFFTISLFILIMIFSTVTSSMIQRRFQKRLEEKKKGKPYNFTNNVEFKNPIKTIKANYGKVDLYLENKVLYTLVTVDDAETFFSNDQQQIKFNIDQRKYNKLIQFYIFDIKDSNLFKKISIINYQAKNFYIGSFIIDNFSHQIYQTDKVKPNDEYQPLFDKFIELLELQQNN